MKEIIFLGGFWQGALVFFSFLLSFLFSSYFFWKRLKDDYDEREILGGSLVIFILALIFTASLLWFLQTYGDSLFNRWLLAFAFFFWGIVFGAKIWSAKRKINVWEVLDGLALTLVCFLVWGGFLLGWLVKEKLALFLFLAGGILGGLFQYSKKRYRSFYWYKSGKTGFLFWQSGGVFFLCLFLLAFFNKNGIYFERLVLGFSLLACFCVLYFRSERKIKEDWRDLNKYFLKRNKKR